MDRRIQNFLDNHLREAGGAPPLPGRTFILDYPGLARVLSIPFDGDHFTSDIIHSYRVKQGVLHNPKSDRRTTKGIFHIAEGGLPIPHDKCAVPKEVFGRILRRALNPPHEMMRLPFTSNQEEQAECWVSLLLRPIVCPEVPEFTPEKQMEIRFFAPGGLISSLDFVERIFGNAGDPYLPENDSGLDASHWTGHTGCVILAPHLPTMTKKEVGLPRWEDATERQRTDGMCWKTEDERYNNGSAFKLTCRDRSGVMVTIIADNYFGYCKKEVKTQLGMAANLFGMKISLAGPDGFDAAPEFDQLLESEGYTKGYEFTTDPFEAVHDADVVYTDVWISMGKEEESAERIKLMSPFSVTSKLMAAAKPDALFMHCLPAHAGQEVTQEVLDSPRSIIFDQAENRLHMQKAIMATLALAARA